jgi:hypothetical protein
MTYLQSTVDRFLEEMEKLEQKRATLNKSLNLLYHPTVEALAAVHPDCTLQVHTFGKPEVLFVSSFYNRETRDLTPEAREALANLATEADSDGYVIRADHLLYEDDNMKISLYISVYVDWSPEEIDLLESINKFTHVHTRHLSCDIPA